MKILNEDELLIFRFLEVPKEELYEKYIRAKYTKIENPLSFYITWNVLIEVVEKIERDSFELFGEYKNVIINGCSCYIDTDFDIISMTESTKIKAVYEAVILYIKWYNEYKNKKS